MSARDLEDFIKVIESAEKLSTLCNKSRNQKPAPSIYSVASSYPTDIFLASKSLRNEKRNYKRDPGSQVPKLWNPKTGSEFLGSSWASLGSNAHEKSSVRRSSSSNTDEVKSRSLNSCSSLAATSARSSDIDLTRQNCNIVEENALIESKGKNLLLALQRNSSFGRIIAKDLSPAVTPDSSPSCKRRTKKEAPTASTDNGRTAATSSSTALSFSPKGIPPRRSRSASKDSKASSAASSAKSNVSAPSSPTKKSSCQNWTASHSGTRSPDSSVLEVVIAESPEVPRSPPIPMPRVIIRQSSVKMHVHVNEDDHTRSTVKIKSDLENIPLNRPKPSSKVELTVDLRNYSKSLKLLGLDIPSNRKEATKLMNHSVNIKTTSPSLMTRLKERTQSVSDLQEIIDSKEQLPQEKYKEIKDPLVKAVFEEWYFRKVAQEIEVKRMEAERKEKEEYEKEVNQEEKKMTSSKAYKQWLVLKKIQFMKSSNLAKEESEGDLKREEKIAKIKQAEIDWREGKRTEYLKMQKRKLQKLKELEEELKLKEKKRAQAEKHFNDWKDKSSKALREKVKNAKQMKLLELEQKIAKAKEKKEEGAAAFNAWTRRKDELKVINVEDDKHAKKDDDIHDDKVNAARQAYEEWLEYVEQREVEERCIEEEHMLRMLWRPPWYPPGVAEF